MNVVVVGCYGKIKWMWLVGWQVGNINWIIDIGCGGGGGWLVVVLASCSCVGSNSNITY